MDQDLIKKLQLFKKQASMLRLNADFFKNLSWSLEYKQDEGIKINFKSRPDDQVVKSTLLNLRPFLLEGEPVNFYHVCNLLYQNLVDSELLNKIKQAREAWSILLERKKQGPPGGVRLKIEGKDILSEENLNFWLYGEYFHLEEEKIRVLERMHLTPMGGLSFMLFLDLLQKLSFLVFYLEKNVVDKVFEENI